VVDLDKIQNTPMGQKNAYIGIFYLFTLSIVFSGLGDDIPMWADGERWQNNWRGCATRLGWAPQIFPLLVWNKLAIQDVRRENDNSDDVTL
jgi:hypothetical protein